MPVDSPRLNDSTKRHWWQIAFGQAREHPLTSLALLGATLVVLILLVPGLITALGTDQRQFLIWAVLGGSLGWLSTTLGASPALFLRRLGARTEDTMLGFAAGMMLAAAAFSLLLPGIAAAEVLTGAAWSGALLVCAGMALGVLLMLAMHQFLPHEHGRIGAVGPGHDRFARIWLFVFAIALHNLPEGMAVGVGFSQGDLSVGVPLMLAIALQNIPEGLAVALTLRAIGYRPVIAVAAASATGSIEILGAVIGVGIASGAPIAYPVGLGLAAGAMIFVVSHEVIPETHRNGHQTPATVGLLGGFALLLILDSALAG